jgi:hypothetical protein
MVVSVGEGADTVILLDVGRIVIPEGLMQQTVMMAIMEV